MSSLIALNVYSLIVFPLQEHVENRWKCLAFFPSSSKSPASLSQSCGGATNATPQQVLSQATNKRHPAVFLRRKERCKENVDLLQEQKTGELAFQSWNVYIYITIIIIYNHPCWKMVWNSIQRILCKSNLRKSNCPIWVVFSTWIAWFFAWKFHLNKNPKWSQMVETFTSTFLRCQQDSWSI